MGDLVPLRIRGRYFSARQAVSLLAGMVLGIFAGVPLLGWLFRLAARLVQFALFAVGVMCFVLLTSSGKAVELPVVGKIHILD